MTEINSRDKKWIIGYNPEIEREKAFEIFENSIEKIKDFIKSEFEQYNENGKPFHKEEDIKKISNICQWLDQCHYFDIKEKFNIKDSN